MQRPGLNCYWQHRQQKTIEGQLGEPWQVEIHVLPYQSPGASFTATAVTSRVRIYVLPFEVIDWACGAADGKAKLSLEKLSTLVFGNSTEWRNR